ncbi:MAG: hypothetical protein R2733_24745 [Acidimicrobiales bacterium]
MADHDAPRPDDNEPESASRHRRATGEDFTRRLEERFVAAMVDFDEEAARRLPTTLREHLHLLIRQGGLDVGSDNLRLAAVTGVCQQAMAFSVYDTDAFDTLGYQPLEAIDTETAQALVAGVRELGAMANSDATTVMYARTTPALLDGLISYRGSADHLAHHVCFAFMLSLSCGAGTTSPDREFAEALRAALPDPVLPILN